MRYEFKEINKVNFSIYDSPFSNWLIDYSNNPTNNKAIQSILPSLYKCQRGVRLSMDCQTYTRPKRYPKDKWVSYNDVRKGLDWLTEMGLILIEKGDYVKGIQTILRPTSLFISLVNEFNQLHIVSQREEVRFSENHSCYLVKHKDKNTIKYEVADYLIQFNRYNTEFEWTVEGDYSLCYENTNILIPTNLWHRRIFNRNKKRGGRYFSSIQNVPSKYRDSIKVNGESTIEKDFKSMNTRMLYALEGISFQGDCYDISREIPNYNRALTKKVMTFIFNIEGNRGGLGFVLMGHLKDRCVEVAKEGVFPKEVNDYILSDDKESYKGARLVVDQHIKACEKSHKRLSKYFYKKELCFTLMNKESEITKRVIQSFTKINQPLLPIHDGYVTTEKNEEFLVEEMRKAFYDVFKVEASINAIA